MTDAPERIWAFYAPHISEDEDGATIVAYETRQYGAAEYIRVDIHEAEIERLREALDAMLHWADEFSQQVEASDPAAFREDYNTAAALIDREDDQ